MLKRQVPASMGEVYSKGAEGKMLATVHAENLYEGTAEQVALTQATPLMWSKSAQKGKAEVGQVNQMMKPVFYGAVGGCLGGRLPTVRASTPAKTFGSRPPVSHAKERTVGRGLGGHPQDDGFQHPQL